MTDNTARSEEYVRGRESAAEQLEAEATDYEHQFPHPAVGSASYVAPGLLREMARLIREDHARPDL